MIDFSIDKIKGAVILDTRRIKKRKLYPVKYRITHERKQMYFSSGYDLSIDDWDKLEASKETRLVRIKNLIKLGLRKLENEIEDMVRTTGFSFNELKRRTGKSKSDMLFMAFQNKIKMLEEEGRSGSAIYYQTALNNIKKFEGDKRFTEITPEWLRRFEQYLLKSGKSRTSIGMWMRAIKSIVNEYGNLKEVQYPFSHNQYDKKFRIKQGEGRKIALTLEQINILMSAPMVKDNDKMARDLWYFMYLCNGLNISDLCRLKYENIDKRLNEIIWYRKKTISTDTRSKAIRAVLLPQMQEIIDKYGNKDKSGYIFPYLHEGITPAEETRIVKKFTSSLNKRLSVIGKKCGIGPISTYTARHSFATILKRAGTSISFISEALGHSNLSVTENYLASFESEERRKQAQKLI